VKSLLWKRFHIGKHYVDRDMRGDIVICGEKGGGLWGVSIENPGVTRAQSD
jgi:hypothetical protein